MPTTGYQAVASGSDRTHSPLRLHICYRQRSEPGPAAPHRAGLSDDGSGFAFYIKLLKDSINQNQIFGIYKALTCALDLLHTLGIAVSSEPTHGLQPHAFSCGL